MAKIKNTARLLVMFVMLFASVRSEAQTNEETFVRKGTLRATATFATGFMPKQGINNLYLTGNIEYYPDTKISIRGESYYFFNSMNQDKTLKMNHSIFYGGAYHFGSGAFDPFIGIQSGLALSQSGIVAAGDPPRAKALNPLFSPLVGFNYYANNWFHLFINTRYVYGNHLANDAIISLNEWNVSFGLGFNINTQRRSKA